MLVLDENVPDSQQQLLRRRRIRFRVVGVDLATAGTADDNLLPCLHRLPRPTFFTLDRDFHRRDWAHPNHCLVWLDMPDDRAAEFIRRFLRHPAFATQAKRMGLVVRVHAGGLVVRRRGKRTPELVPWPQV